MTSMPRGKVEFPKERTIDVSSVCRRCGGKAEGLDDFKELVDFLNTGCCMKVRLSDRRDATEGQGSVKCRLHVYHPWSGDVYHHASEGMGT
jgi:hypothetical protein